MNYLFFTVSCLFSFYSGGQSLIPFDRKPPQPVYRTINAENGLPSSETYDIHQDRNGYIWIATDRGVVRFDGYRYRIFTKKDGLADNVIFKLEEDYQGRVWFVSYKGLLSYAENGKIVPYKYNSKISEIVGGLNPTFKTLRIDKQGNLYYAIQDLGSVKITPEGVLTRIHPESVVGIHAIQVEDKWLPSYQYFKRKKRETRMYASRPVNGFYRSYDIRKDFGMKDSDSFLARILVNMASGRAGVFMQLDDLIMDLKTGKPLFGETSILGLDCVDDKLFTGIFRSGVRMDDMSLPKAVRTQYFLRGYSVTSVMKDREGGYWFTTLENGVYYTPDLNVRSYTVAEGLPNPDILTIAGIRDEIWGTYYTGSVRLSGPPSVMVVPMIKFFPIVVATDHFFFFNTEFTMKLIRNGNRIHTMSHSDAYAIGDHAIGCRLRIYKTPEKGDIEELYNSFNYESVASTKNPTTFGAVVETGDKRLFAGNLDGLFEIRNNKALAVPGDPVFRERVIDLAWNASFGVVAATRGQGIYFFDRNYRITRRIDASDGLLNDQVNSLYVDQKGRLYVATSNGLNVITFTKKGFTMMNLTTQQGLCSNEVNAVYEYRDNVWVATKAGVSIISLNRPQPEVRSSVKLEYLSTEDAQYEAGKLPESLAPLTELIRIGLRTDNFRGAARHEFSYQLRKDGPWLNTSQPEININNPADMDYAVSVKFRNDEGNWSAPFLLARFTVETPYYKTWYFISLVVIITLVLIYLVFRVIVKRIKTRHHYETRINKLEQKALSAQMNPHFIFNSLNSIQSFLIYEENEKAEKYLLTFSSLIRQTLANSREHYIRLEEELSILSNYLALEQMRFRDKFTFTLKFELGQREMQYFLPPMLIQPYIENAVVHGVAPKENGGKIDVTFSLIAENRLLVVIDDNGVGRKKSGSTGSGSHRSFGTTITQERLTVFKKQLGGEFHVKITDKEENGIPSGTHIELIIPLLATYEREETP